MKFLFSLVCLFPTLVQATTVNLGALSYDTFIPSAGAFIGTDAFDIANLTGAFDLPPDFPVVESVIFQSAKLTLSDGEVFMLGNIGPGFLLDGSGNPIIQVPANKAFTSAEFTATLSAAVLSLAGGTTFTPGSTAIDVLLLPSSGLTLTADVDQTTIEASTSPTITPEPATGWLVMAGLPWLIYRARRKRAARRQSGKI